MSETAGKSVRLSKVTRDFNLGVHTVVEFLAEKGHAVEESPNAKIPGDLYALLEKEFGQDKAEKEASKQVIQERQEREVVALASVPEPVAPPESASAPPVADAQVAPAAPAEKKAAPKAKSTEPAAPAEPSAAASDVFRATTLRVTGPKTCLLYTSPSPRDRTRSRMPSSA